MSDFSKAVTANPFGRRQFLRGGALTAGAVLLGAGCSAKPENARTNTGSTTAGTKPAADATGSIRVMVWSGLVEPIVREQAVVPFNKKYPNVKVELEVGTNADLYPKLLAAKGSAQYAGAMMNDLFSARGNMDGMWAPPNLTIMENAKEVPAELNPPGGFAIALMLTGQGLIYNPDEVEAPTSWKDLYRPEYAGRVVMSDGYFGAYSMASLIEGGDVNDIPGGIEVWKKYRRNIGAWTNSEGQKAELISSGSMWIAPGFGAWAEQEIAKGRKIAFAAPEEGQIRWSGSLQVLGGVEEVDSGLVAAFFDEFYSREFQEQFVKQGFFIPARADVEIPSDIADRSQAVMTASEARKALVPYDVEAVAKSQRDYTAQIQRTLKA